MSRRVLIFVAAGVAAVLVVAFLLLRGGGSEEPPPAARACDVLTEQAAESLLGAVSRSADVADGGLTRCQYVSESTGGSVDLTAQRFQEADGTSAVRRAEEDIRRLHEGRSTSYPGLGDEAYLLSVEGVPDPSGRQVGGATTLSTRVGDLRVTVFLNGVSDPERARESAERLIRDYLARTGEG